METANITYQDEDGNIKVDIDRDKCIACGWCISACKHEARYFDDDTERFFNDLRSGKPISLMTAPAIRTNIPEYKKLFTWLKQLGVKNIYDVSLGADICIWGHVKYVERNMPLPIITQPCPAIVTYLEMYRQDLLPRLSPVHGPMGCASIYMRKYQGITDSIAAISPCLAKKNEFVDTGISDYNITFEKLVEYLETNNINLPDEETQFDHEECGLGSLFPMPGGLKENIEYFTGKKLHIAKAEGFEVYEKLNEYANTSVEFLPDIYDVLNCTEGCNIGPAALHKKNVFEIDKTMEIRRKKATDKRKKGFYEEVYKKYDDKFDLSDFLRVYQPIETTFPQITEKDIGKAFEVLGKVDYEKQHIDCSACGSQTCHDMARKVALDVNIPENCVFKTKEDAKNEHDDNIRAYKQLADMEKMHEADERMRTMLDANSHINILFDNNFKVVDCNPAALKFLGFETKEDLFVGLFDRMTKSLPSYQSDGRASVSLSDRLKTAVKEGFVKFETELIINEDKRSLEVEFKKIPYQESFAIVGYVYDMTEKSNLLTETIELKKDLELEMIAAQSASKAKSIFLSTMSHEIRTPMNAIIGMTTIGKSADDIERKDYSLNKIEDASKHLLGVINDILDTSKIEAGKFDLSHEEFNFEKILHRVANVVNHKIVDKRQKFTIYVDRDVPEYMVGDDQRLAQVITNLVGNAVKFTPEEGSIRIGTYFLGEKDGICTVKITVTDDGIGISKEQQSRLFQSFQQAENSTSRKFGGTGLGLKISKSIVEMMGGEIWIESELGKGATFAFTVQLKRSDVDKQKLLGYGLNWNNVRILVVESDVGTDAFFKKITGEFGAQCDTALTRADALRLVKENGAYDIYFIGYKLPDMDALALISELKEFKNEKGESTVAMFTDINFNILEKDAKEAGVSKFVSKPLFPSNIIDTTNEILGLGHKHSDEMTPEAEVVFEGRNILLAEDVEINREIVQTLLEPTLINIDCAENGVEAVRMFTSNPDKYDMIFMDVQMPEMDGYEATRTIRGKRAEWAKNIPIVAMTANVFKEDIEKCLESGMDGHIGKPLNYNEVIDVLEKHLK